MTVAEPAVPRAAREIAQAVAARVGFYGFAASVSAFFALPLL